MKRILLAIALTLPLAACETSDGGGTVTNPPALAPSADLSDMVGARAGQGELGLQNRGYQPVRTQGLTSYWWNAGAQACARIVTSNGRFETITPTSPSDCNQSQAGVQPGLGGPPTPAQQACLRDVARTTNNRDVRVLQSSFSQAGTEVIVGVGPTGKWSCIAYSDGSTAGIESMTDEGNL